MNSGWTAMLRLALCAAAAGLVPTSVFGWGAEAHETIGLLAERQIAGTRSAGEVKRLLRPGETMAVVSTWADRIKREGFDPESNDYVARNPAHPTYHYTDIPFQAAEYRASLIGARPDDLVQLYTRCIDILRGKSDPRANPTGITPRVALMLVVHFAGDIQQPFHVGGGYIAESGGVARFVDPRGSHRVKFRSDIGGNALLIGPANLHYYWDVLAVQRAMQQATGGTNVPAYADWLAARYPPQRSWEPMGRPDTWPAQWATAVLPLCREMRAGLVLGPRVEAPNPRPPPPFRSEWMVELPPRYERRAVEVVNGQLARGGYGLAQVLKAIWPETAQ
jgi:hypothetical protein